MVKNFQAGSKWLPGVISKRTGPVLFVVQMSDGCERCCHQDKLQGRTDVTVDKPFETDITPSSAVPQICTHHQIQNQLLECQVDQNKLLRHQNDLFPVNPSEKLIQPTIELLYKGINLLDDELNYVLD